MKLAIFSDIHANLEALQAVLEDMTTQGVTQKICLGDIVGYGADPCACLEVVRSLGCHVIRGNHDHEVYQDHPLVNFRPFVRAGLEYSRERLSVNQKEYLALLPFKLVWENAYLVHASLYEPEKWHYLNTALNIEINFQHQKTPICFCGHTHVPRFYEKALITRMQEPFANHKIQSGKKYMINVGSVGQPRDNNPHASYVIYHVEEARIEFRRVPYNIALAQRKILDAGLPPQLAERLTLGK